MASIINATTTNGVAISADNSGILQLATNSGTTALTLSVAQAATFVSSVTATSLTAPILSSATTLSLQTNGSTTAVTIDASQNVSFAKGFTVGATASPAFSISMSANQTIASATFTKLAFNTKQFDTNTNFDATTNYRFTPTIAGYYQINLTLATAAAGTAGGVVLGNIYKNGILYSTPSVYLDSNLTNLAASGSHIISMNGTTDYIEFYAYQSTGLSQNILGGTISNTLCSGALIRSA